MKNEVRHRDEIFVGKPENTLCWTTREISIFGSNFKNTGRFGKVRKYKLKGCNIFLEWTDPDYRRLL
jgi:hypothetical protein